MESNTQLTFLTKPTFTNLPHVQNQKKDIYVNLFKISLKKPLKVYQYPYKVIPEIAVENQTIRDKLLKYSLGKLRGYYGECFVSGDKLYALEKVTESREIKTKIYGGGEMTEYTIQFQPFSNETTIEPQKVANDQVGKQCVEVMLRDILHSNPNLDFYKGLFVNKTSKKPIESDRVSVYFYPGFTTSFMQTMNGSFLNVTLKNKILSTQTILELINEMKANRRSKEVIHKMLVERSFKTNYSNKNYIIDDISFDKNPANTTFNRDGHSITLINYYKEAHGIQIQDRNQPIIIVRRNGPQEQVNTLYFIPELCYLSGLDDAAIKNGQFMKKLADDTKLIPEKRVRKTNEFLQLLDEPKRKKITKTGRTVVEIPSSKEKKEQYGFTISPVDTPFKASFMEEPSFTGAGNKSINPSKKVFPVSKPILMNKWLCLYDKRNYNDAENLLNSLQKASGGYHIKIEEPEWVEMTSTYADDWTATVDEYFKETTYQFVLFLLDRNDSIYPALKKHSLTTRGYNSQVVKTFSLRKNALSVCSKILLQINAKLGGSSYHVNFDNSIYQQKLMVVGVDSSHVQGKRTGVAMVASLNADFTNFYNKESIIDEKNNREQLQYCVSEFLEEALQHYYKANKALPGGVIIYRQGVSLQQKEFLKSEATAIDNFLRGKKVGSYLSGKSIPYYYILVNTKTTYKFFETSRGKQGVNYSNPGPGLLVYEGVTNPNFFEFYIQPQEVTGGSATPTCYHVAYGNLENPGFLPKFTYDLCHIYSNWQGPVRVPNILKSAEKLSKMTAKYTKGELHKKLAIGQSYL